MARPGLKEAILDAAESIVLESGASRMTLDAVAERADVSKGGLMYHFPSKEALLKAMVERLLERHDRLREEIRQKLSPDASPLEIEINLVKELFDMDFHLSSALLAAHANQPGLLEVFRVKLREQLKKIAPPEHFEHAAILYFAALGLHTNALLGLLVLTKEQRNRVFKELLHLASAEGLEQW